MKIKTTLKKLKRGDVVSIDWIDAGDLNDSPSSWFSQEEAEKVFKEISVQTIADFRKIAGSKNLGDGAFCSVLVLLKSNHVSVEESILKTVKKTLFINNLLSSHSQLLWVSRFSLFRSLQLNFFIDAR